MAVPAYATDLNDIFLDGSAAWGLISGGKQTAVETDDYIQGSSCWSHDPFSSGIEGGMYNSAETIATDDAVYVWIKADIAAAMATHAAGGMQICMGDTSPVVTPNYDAWYVRGSDDYQYGGWICIPVDPTTTPSTTVGSPSATRSWFGARWNIPGAGPNKGYPFKVDAMRHGRQIEITAGEVANPATWPLLATHDATTSRQWGICQPTNTGAAIQGLLYWGTAAASVYSRDSNQTIVVNDTEFTIAAFTQILFAHASNDVEWDNVGLIALGTSNRGIIDVTANGTIKWTNSVFQDIGATTLLSNCTFDGTKWLGTNEVDAGGASLLGCKILLPTVAANSYGLLWNVATDPDGKLDGMEFSKGAAAHHAITFGTTSPLTMTLNNIAFGTGFSGTAGGTTGDETFHVLRTSGTVTINLLGCTGNVGYRTAGATVVIAQSVSVVVDGVTEGTAIKVIADETVGTITAGDVLQEGIADSTGGISFSLNYEGAFGAGLDVLIRARNQGLAMAAIADDGGTQTDETAEANSSSTNDMILTPAVPVVGDAYYFGHNEDFSRLKVWVSTVGVNQTITWEYWNGAWTALSGVVDGTSSFTAAGDKIVTWTAPSDWADTTVNSQGPYKYVRARVSAVGGSPTGAQARQCQLDVARYLPIPPSGELKRTITPSGLTATLAQAVDSISRPFG